MRGKVHCGNLSLGESRGDAACFWAKKGDRRYCFVGIWESEENLVAARPQLIEHLNSVRDFFEELFPERGVTDPVSGPVVTHKS